ncbi:MAG: hypothetical protein IPO58_11450 [Betaproteobacteria bacterium]|nr:hypothetical protein [Betaproteobacteria bacterium]
MEDALAVEAGCPQSCRHRRRSDHRRGGIGVSGVTSPQDGIVAKAGADALK